MDGRQFLANTFTPEFLMGLCEGLTDFQAYDSLKPFMGQWIRVRGLLVFATPNPAYGTAGVTIEFPEKVGKRREAFLTFTRNFAALAEASSGDVIWAEGMITAITEYRLQLEDCELVDPRLAATLEVGYRP